MRGKLAILIALSLGFTATAADLTTGYSFSSGELNVTHTKLNNAVNLATINTTFFTDKSAVSSLNSADTFLVYVPSLTAFRKVTAGTLLLNNTDLITGQTEDTTPATGDFLLTYDVGGAAYKKATLLNAVFENAALISARTNWNTPDSDTFYLGYNNGAWTKTARSNLVYNLWSWRTTDWTNLTAHVAPTNGDALLIFDEVSGTKKQLSLVALFSNAPPVSSLASTDVVAGVVAGKLSTIPFSALVQSGQQVGLAITNVTTTLSTTASIPLDDTIPQNTEGTNILTLSYTPKYADSILEVEASVPYENSVASQTQVIALFTNSAANAIAANWRGTDQNSDPRDVLNLQHSFVAGSTSALTISVHVGTSLGNLNLNAVAGGTRVFGGVMARRLTVKEIRP